MFRTVGRTTLVVLFAGTPNTALAQVPEFGLPQDTVLLDEKITITLTRLPPNRAVTLHLGNAGDEGRWTSSATFLSDRAGRIDLSRMAPIAGNYAGVDAMGLFWSAQLDSSARRPASSRAVARNPPPQPWELRAESGGLTLAIDTVWRGAVKAGIRLTRVSDQGLVGTFYQPQWSTPAPGILALSGAGGGLLSAAEHPGGIASRGYAVLSLAYFATEGVPPQLSRIKLEYFKAALDWLRTQPGVDPERIGVLGISRGGELALLLGATYPEIKAVLAYVPSHVVWGGCCDSAAQAGPAWTQGGKPVPHMPPAPELRAAVRPLSQTRPARRTPVFHLRLEDTAAVARAAIPVERIKGPVLLISGREDQVWPSFFMAEQVMGRLRRYSFKHSYRHLAYSGAGHAIGRPYTSTMDVNVQRHRLMKTLLDSGGNPQGTAWANEDSWSKILEFLAMYLGVRAPNQN